jgi:hypothetical protein
MTKIRILAIFCAFEALLTTPASAKNLHTKTVPAHDAGRTPSPAIGSKSHFILRQDLFDRLNPHNLRSDWPGPPAQPDQL